MNYAFFVGFDILDLTNYSGLSSAQRAELRREFLERVDAILQRCGEFDTDNPASRLRSLVQDASVSVGRPWSIGAPLQDGWVYEPDPRTGKLVCRWVADLMLGGSQQHETITLDGVSVRAKFHVGYSAQNGPYATG